MPEQNVCPICGSVAFVQHNLDPVKIFYSCPVCGRFEFYPVFAEFTDFNYNKLSSYLAYNGFIENTLEYRYFTTMSKEKCDEYKKEFESGNCEHGHPVHISKENVENWYPKTFSDKIDHVLLYLYEHLDFMGQSKCFSKEALFSWLFVDRFVYQYGNRSERIESDLETQARFMIDFLVESSLIILSAPESEKIWRNSITLSPKGYSRVDELQKNTATGKKVLVAMKFGDDTKQLREAIRQGITDAGYIAILIDEVEHNDFITPELLKHIKDSKFVVVDLSHQNNGAYFEEGYAMGLGKPVIQLCQKDKRLHFDIAQKNTIMWESEEDIPIKLMNRIIATID